MIFHFMIFGDPELKRVNFILYIIRVKSLWLGGFQLINKIDANFVLNNV